MTKDEAKQLKYVENQRDQARAELVTARATAREAIEKHNALRDVFNGQLHDVTSDRDALRDANTTLRESNALLRAEFDRIKRVSDDQGRAVQAAQDELARVNAKLAALEADTEGKDKLKKRLAAKAEELRLCQNELGALKAMTFKPRSLDGMMADAIRQFGPDAVIGHIMSSVKP